MSKTSESRADRRCIGHFAEFFRQIDKRVSGVDEWPEDRKQGDIDAIVRPYAIEHVSFDAFEGARDLKSRFTQVTAGLEDEFRNKLGFRLKIGFNVYAIEKGNWPAVNAAFHEWIYRASPTLANGRHTLNNVPKIPFAFDVVKGEGPNTDGVIFARHAPNDLTLNKRLKENLTERHGKINKLLPYRKDGLTTLLLLESGSDDFTLMDGHTLAEAFQNAFSTWPIELDELWSVQGQSAHELNIYDLVRGRAWIFDADKRIIVAHNNCAPKVQLIDMPCGEKDDYYDAI